MTALQYPLNDQIPEPGRLTEIVPGVMWLRMPLPMALDHINLYMLEDHDGWWLIDTGFGVGPTQQHWQSIFDEALCGKPVKAVVCTHMHPDHCGQAGWLCDRWRVPLYMTLGEYMSARAYSKFTVDDFSWTTEEYYQRAGMPPDYFEDMKANFHGFGSVSTPLPGAFKRLEDSDYLTIGDVRWRVLIGRGHSPEHACLYSAALNILISGDQVIPRITSNVGVSPAEPEGNPLKHWLASHEKLLAALPADALVLPAHNTPFYGLHDRLRFLIQHHEDHLLALEQACLRPQTAAELLPVMFERELEGHNVGLALGECVAHLNYLLQRSQLQRSLNADGQWQYLSIDESLGRRLRQAGYDPDDIPMEV